VAMFGDLSIDDRGKEMSEEERKIAKGGEEGQANYLTEARLAK
jgi:hypothetical protein